MKAVLMCNVTGTFTGVVDAVTAAALKADDVSARLVVDGLPFSESLSTYKQITKQLSNGLLERDLLLHLKAGDHTVQVQVSYAVHNVSKVVLLRILSYMQLQQQCV
jgi:hypothetical protein